MPSVNEEKYMKHDEKLIIKVPASTANLGSGFDSIGVAFQLYTTLIVEPANRLQFIWDGPVFDGYTISEKNNLINKALALVFHKFKQEVPPLQVTVQSDIPISRGLGSSAAAFVAGLVLANELLGQPLTNDDLLWLATKEEGHPDNVGASLLGGLIVACVDWNKERVTYHKQSFPYSYEWLAAIPSYPLQTSLARNRLPSRYETHNVIFNLSRFGLLVASLITGNREGLAKGLEDALHQPYRSDLIPGFTHLLDEKDSLGVIGFVISGAGPTILALMDHSTNKQALIEAFNHYLSTASHTVHFRQLQVDQKGYQVQRIPTVCV